MKFTLNWLYDHLDTKTDIKDIELTLNNIGGISARKNMIGFRLNECIFTSPVFYIKSGNNDTIKYDNTIKIYLDYIDNLTKNKKITPKFIKKYELLNNDAYKRFKINDTILLHMFLDRLSMNEKISILKDLLIDYIKIIKD